MTRGVHQAGIRHGHGHSRSVTHLAVPSEVWWLLVWTIEVAGAAFADLVL